MYNALFFPFLWLYEVIHGYMWLYTVIHVYPWLYGAICGYMGGYMWLNRVILGYRMGIKFRGLNFRSLRGWAFIN